MQLLCNGVALDLYDNAGLQFTHENPLFAFDDLKCERTTNFKLPLTPTNDRVFSLAKIPAYSGEGMRRKFPCQLQAGAVVRDGYLYVANFDGKDYNAVFVTGELVGLQRIKDLGKLADIADWSYAIRSGYDVYDASAATFKTFMFSAYRYHTPTGVSVMPSINLGKLAEYACAQNNVPVTIPAKAYDMRIALAELKTPEDATAHIFSQKETSDEWYNSIEPDGFIKYLTENHGLVALKTITYHRGHSNPQGEVLQTDETRKMVEHYRCPNDISITFPEDFPDNYFLVYMNPLVTGQCVFLGDYSFTRSISGMGEGTYTTTGEPLAGRTIDIPANTSFILIRTIVDGDVSKSDYACRAENTYIYIDDEPVAVTAVTRGWEFAQADALAYDIEVQVSTSSENAGEWRLQDNLPDITLTELLKAIAAELGYILNYTEADGIIFDTIDTDAVTVKSLDTLTKKGEVVRTFGKYAQHNYVQFADDEQFQNVQFTAVDYTIDNDNISNDKTLLKLPWTCGVQDAQYVRDKAGRTKPLEIRFNPEEFGIYALFAKIEKNADIQNICDRSTQIKIEARMPLLQYDAIKPKTGLLVDGSTYLWTERSWQKDVAKMTLAQFGKAIVPPAPPTPILPPEYQQVEWMSGWWQNTIGACIVIPLANSRSLCTYFYCDFQFGATATDICPCGVRWNSSIPFVMFTKPNLYLHSGNSAFDWGTFAMNNDENRQNVLYDGSAVYHNGIFMQNYQIYSPSLNMPVRWFYLFCEGYNGSTPQPNLGGGTLYEVEFANETNHFHIYPCYRKSDHEPGVYDIINNVFYPKSLGTYDLILGPDVN